MAFPAKKHRLQMDLPAVCDTPSGKDLPICDPEHLQKMVNQHIQDSGHEGSVKISKHDEM